MLAAFVLAVAIPASEMSIALMIVALLMAAHLVNLSSAIPVLWRYAHRLTLEEAQIVAWNAFGRRQCLEYSEIESITENLKGRGTIILTGPWNSIRYGPPVKDLGELTESLLKQASRCRHIALAQMPENREAWQKAPDWNIINEAIARAEENARKEKAGVWI